MQPHDSSRSRFPPAPQSSLPPEVDAGGATPRTPGWRRSCRSRSRASSSPRRRCSSRRSFRDVPLASRLLRADEARSFTVGAARGADAPVNPAYSAGVRVAGPAATCWSSRSPGGFAINLAPAMHAELQTPVQVLPLRPDFGRAEAPLDAAGRTRGFA